MTKQKIYLQSKDLDVVIDEFVLACQTNWKLDIIDVPTKDACNYITAQPVFASYSAPNYNASAMDGYAVIDSDTAMANSNNPVYLSPDQYCYVDTGDVIEPKYNAVIMIEDVVMQADESLMIVEPVSYFQHIRAIGEDVCQTQMIVQSYHRLRCQDLGPILASKNEVVRVFKKLKVGILATGDEIVDVSVQEYVQGMIIDTNSTMIAGLVDKMHLDYYIYECVKDNLDDLSCAIQKAVSEVDILIINAGSSAGSEDYTHSVLERLGTVYTHGIAIKPGKPAIVSRIDNCLVFGLPGYPVAAYMVFEKVVKPVLNQLLRQCDDVNYLSAKLTKTVYSSLKHLEFVCVKVSYVNNEWVCTPLSRGSGVSMSLLLADGIIEVEKSSEGISAGSHVKVQLLKPLQEISNQVCLMGSHDVVIDIISDLACIHNHALKIASSHVGSYAGLIALKKKECLLAPSHILGSDGLYNRQIVAKLFEDERMLLIKGVMRRQVLAYRIDNPKQITSFKDIAREGIKYVNRQVGSGTAILFDYLCNQNGIDAHAVVGHDFVMPSHLNVAAAINNQTADCGLMIKSVADSFGLGYIEVTSEQYDFAIYEKDLLNPNVQTIITILKSQAFRDAVEQFDCYDTQNSGQVEEVL